MRRRVRKSVIDVGSIGDMNAANTDGLRKGVEFRIVKISFVREKTRGFLLKFDETERAVVKDNNLHKQLKLREADEIAHQHGEAAT
jgi:hypothetical protein